MKNDPFKFVSFVFCVLFFDINTIHNEYFILFEQRSIIIIKMTDNTHIPWVEKYRPLRFQDIVLDPLNRELFQKSLQKGYFPNLLFYGPPGTGKTTTIINLINEYQQRYSNRMNKSTVIHLNASDERGIDTIRNQIHQFVRSMNLFETGMKFVILDEVDYMTKTAQQALKHILQTSRNNVCFCLICNYITKIDEALKNEFLCIRFNQLPRQEITHFLKTIAHAEGLYIPDDLIVGIQDRYKSDIRSMINFIQMNQHIFAGGCNTNSIISYNAIHLLQNTVLEEFFNKVNHINQQNDHDQPLEPYIYNLTIRYNMDRQSIIQSLRNYIVRQHPDCIENTFPVLESLLYYRTNRVV